MKILVVEDDFISRKLLSNLLKSYGEVDAATDGEEAILAFDEAHKAAMPYKLICLDILLPKLTGHEVLRKIREKEKQAGISSKDEAKVIMTSVLEDPKNVIEALHKGGATGYMVKPIEKEKLLFELKELGIL